ncbi:hypothetical protein GeomeDRAFT_0674 [Geobacter metallireducens RCH3]|uniref:Nucleotidyltransferase n=1 Tax=Geobacter metallireducens (strain ATCC 53774 / DSM 7210 / GS-15) TaxID=269799 RepID=Q39UQ1_GEOMG|nr:hypothetical protein [Geobacter metallireducens]ABB32023.1 hypothetical protein Gmet_1792 [Geobacter metallireducens GS-15]EHP88792.1 hypothetical protein GeomeDRAFT_0674 [Geobacter metallireducens RCH3]
MKPLKEMTIGEIAAYVAAHLRQGGVEVVLTGGSCVSIYTDNRYLSYDLDFIEVGRASRKKIAAILMEIGFLEKDRYFIHPDTMYFVEFPSGPLALGAEPAGAIAELEFATGTLRLLSPTDCVKDRLAGYYHWLDRQCLEQAIMVAHDAEIDLEEVERWSQQEGMGEEFERIKTFLLAQ